MQLDDDVGLVADGPAHRAYPRSRKLHGFPFEYAVAVGGYGHAAVLAHLQRVELYRVIALFDRPERGLGVLLGAA